MNQRIIYTTSYNAKDVDTKRRVEIAQKSIDEENLLCGNWIVLRDIKFKRDATSIGDDDLPFVRDMISACTTVANAYDIIVISNADVGIMPKTTEKLIQTCNTVGGLYCRRYDFDVLDDIIKEDMCLNNGIKYHGCDFFAFSHHWWVMHEKKFPDMILGRQLWDLIYRRAIMDLGGIELDRTIYHQKHSSKWDLKSRVPGNLYNEKLSL